MTTNKISLIMNIIEQNRICSDQFLLNKEGCIKNMTVYKKEHTSCTQNISIIPTIFLMIGRAIKQKGILEYFYAAQKLREKYPDIIFAFMGEIGVSNSSALTQHELNYWFKNNIIEYWGYHKDIQSYIEKSSCVVLPSYREGIPISLLEAMAMKKPIITTNAPGCKDLIEDGKNGFICEMKNMESLYNAMEKFIHLDNKTRNEMGMFGRKQVQEKYVMNIVWNHYKKIEYEVLSNKIDKN